MAEPVNDPRPSFLVSLRNTFLSGLLMLAPLAVTWGVFAWLFEWVGGSFRPLFFPYLPESIRDWHLVWNILATFVVIVLITVLGYISRYVLGKYFGGLAERFIQSIPGVGNVYNTVKQIVATFGSQHRQLFSKVVLIEFPRAGIYSIGFLTNKAQGEPQAKAKTELWTVFVPTTPNPTSGFLLLLPKEEIRELDMSVGDGMKMIISGGAVLPSWPNGSRSPTPPA
ncbi:hypothetical protein DB347_13875 [Opitutaceae bacterium EW11]|nr:hypothetical protein DB347_13875 [Opitutaceae bacterium EW11]